MNSGAVYCGKHYRFLISTFMVLLVLLSTGQALSQQTVSQSSSQVNTSSHAISLGGTIGVYGELYDKSSGVDRRPGSSARLFFKPTLSIYKSFSISANIILSTEGSSKRQNINQIDFNPKWGWGNAHLGDFNESYSSLTLNGIRIRGGGLTLNPAKFRFSAVAGQTRRATSNTSSSRSFSRSLVGGRIGIGKAGGSFIDLIVLKSHDKASSLPPLDETSDPDDSSSTNEIANPRSIYPEDNLITAIASNLKLFDKKLTWGNEISGSAYTRNTEGKVLTDEDIPSWVDKVFKVRIGSRVDIAYKTDLSYAARNWSMTSGYDFIGPGYISLGLSSMMSDRQALRLGCTYRRKTWTVSLNGARENDNLLDQKSNTTVRQRVLGSLNLRPTKWWNIVFSGNFLNMDNNASSDTTLIDNTNTVFGLNQTFTPIGRHRIQSVSVNYILQRSSDSNPLRQSSKLRAQSIDLRMGIEASPRLSFAPMVGVTVSKIADTDSKTMTTINLNTQYRAVEDRLISNLTLGPTLSSEASTFMTVFNIIYKFSRVDQIQTDIKLNSFRSSGTETDYNENIWNLSVTHRF